MKNQNQKIGSNVCCTSCSGVFVLSHGAQKYCKTCAEKISAEKARKRNVLYRKNLGATSSGSLIKCANCGCDTVKSSTTNVYCNPCRGLRDRSGLPKRREYAKKWYAKSRGSEVIVLKTRIRNLYSQSIRRMGYGKKSRCNEALGCSWEDFKRHIESKFQPSMSWENRHLWHIDHIIPLATAVTEEDVIRLNHYSNLQPLWAADNLRKSDKLDYVIPTS